MLPSLRRTVLDAAYLSIGLLTSIVALAVWITAVSVSLSLAVFIVGLPVIVGAAYVMRWTAELDRRNAALVFGRPVRAHYTAHSEASFLGRVGATLRDSRMWRDLAWLITHSVVGLAFGVVAVSLVASVLGIAALPFWYWAIPDGVQFGLWTADTLPLAILSAFLAVPAGFVSVYLLRGMTRLHAALAVELLGP